MKRLFLYAIILGMFVATAFGCSTTRIEGLVTQFDTNLAKYTDMVWQQKDCRAGLLKSQIDIRQVSIETRTSIEALVSLANKESEDYRKCYYFGQTFNAYLFASKDVIAANTELINMLMGLVR